MSDDLDLRILGIDVDDEEAVDLSDRLYRVLKGWGHDVDGVSPVLGDDPTAGLPSTEWLMQGALDEPFLVVRGDRRFRVTIEETTAGTEGEQR